MHVIQPVITFALAIAGTLAGLDIDVTACSGDVNSISNHESGYGNFLEPYFFVMGHLCKCLALMFEDRFPSCSGLVHGPRRNLFTGKRYLPNTGGPLAETILP